MRRFLVVGAFAVVVIAAGSFFAALKYRPALLPSWARAPFEKSEASADDSSTETPDVSSLEDAPDDGYCAHAGKTSAEGCKPSLPTVRLDSKETAAEIGLRVAAAESREVGPTVSGNAEITYASHDYAHVTSRVNGRVSAVPADEGQIVTAGQVLVVVDSAEVGTAKAQYLSLVPVAQLARDNYDRFAKLEASGAEAKRTVIAAKSDLNRVEADLMKARQQLLNLGYTDKRIAEIEKTRDTSNFIEVLAPMDGTLVERHAIIGEAVGPPSGLVTTQQMNSLFEITDLHHLWCWVDVYEADVPSVRVGQPMRFTISGTESPVFSGHVELIGFAVNPATRTVRVRAEVENIDGRLRANQFGRGVIQVGPKRKAVVVPREAVQNDGAEQFVFLPRDDGLRFRTQRVTTRKIDIPGLVEISWGLEPGSSVVTTGSFLLKSELFKASLGGE